MMTSNDADEPELRRANGNPWYCLATIHGEKPTDPEEWGAKLAAKNRLGWNRWIATALSDEKRAELVKNGFPELELAPFSPEEKSAFCSAFAARRGNENESPPEPAECPDFTSTLFDRPIRFGGFLFARGADFSFATFSDEADFTSATFAGHADFFLVKFSSALFNSATFSDDADFRSAKFSNHGGFNMVTFSGKANFAAATFGSAMFGSVTFSGDTDFSRVEISRRAYFNSATFSGEANFQSATFSDEANFQSATFSDEANFQSATFSDEANFQSATFSDKAYFQSATFSAVIYLVNAKFATKTIFAGTNFRTNVPDFRGATMHEATEWHGAIWPKPAHDRDTAQAQVYSYERLKQEMDRLKKHEDEQSFFRKELRARRGLTSPWSGAWPLNYLYDILSDYGQSLIRPVLWLFGVFVVGFAFFAVAPVFNGTRMTLAHAALVSFADVFSFLPFTREAIGGLSGAAKILGAIQSILAALLLFLLGLALRNRFRMK
jgi:hypothetical protein